MKKTIIILSHVTFDNSLYCSYVHNHAKALAELGYNVIVLAIVKWIPFLSNFQSYKKEFIKNLKNKNIKVDNVEIIYKKTFSISNIFYNSKINFNGIFAYLSLKRNIKKIIKNQNVILIDAHTFKVEGYVAAKIKQKFNIPTFVTLHGTSFVKNLTNKNGKQQIKKVFNTVDKAICVSNKLERYLFDLDIRNTKVIHNGLEIYNIKEKEKKRYSILTVGNLIPIKNINLIIEAIKELKTIYPDIKLSIVGTGKEKESLLELRSQLQLNDTVGFLGRIDNKEVQELMNESFIFILTSVNEGFGIVYPEAMRNKCITIGTKLEGIDGFIKNCENGFLIEPNVSDIVKIIKNIYSEKYDLKSIIKNAQEDANKLTWENNAKSYIKLLEEKE